MRLFRVSCLCLLLGASLFLLAQAFTSLTGTVTDPTGAVIPSAKIVITNTETGAERDTTSDTAGRYTFVQVVPGNYKLTAKASGFTDVVVTNIQLLVNSPGTVAVTFEKVGAVSQTVSVEATSVQINTQDASLGNAIGTQLVMTLPSFARNVTTLLSNQPGVTNFGASTESTTATAQ